MKNLKEQHVWLALRLGIGFIFLWAFFDKLFGLGVATSPDKAWIAGGSPTFGFLKFGTRGPLGEFFQNLAGSAIVDWLFMLGLLFVGITLILGIMARLGSWIGILMLFLMYLALLPPEHNPFIDEHIIYIIILFGLATANTGQYCKLTKKWVNSRLVEKYSILK